MVATVLLKPLPNPVAERLVRVVETVPPDETPHGVAEERVVMEAQRVIDWRGLTKTLSEMDAYVTAFATVSTPEVPPARVVAACHRRSSRCSGHAYSWVERSSKAKSALTPAWSC